MFFIDFGRIWTPKTLPKPLPNPSGLDFGGLLGASWDHLGAILGQSWGYLGHLGGLRPDKKHFLTKIGAV